jgi:hypothetical protein
MPSLLLSPRCAAQAISRVQKKKPPAVRWLSGPLLAALSLALPGGAAMAQTGATPQAIEQVVIKLLKNRPDRQVLPGDLVTSPLLLYLFTLAPPAEFPLTVDWYYEKARQREPRILPFPQQEVSSWHVPGTAEPKS